MVVVFIGQAILARFGGLRRVLVGVLPVGRGGCTGTTVVLLVYLE
jgi:predicted exporter